MLYLLFFLMLIIVILIGYILCKPFFNEPDIEEPSQLNHPPEITYSTLMEEIQRIENDCKAGLITDEVCQTRLEEMKTATLQLHTVYHQAEAELAIKPGLSGIKETQITYLDNKQQNDFDYCPQCGDEVIPEDKFCMHCGHTLHR